MVGKSQNEALNAVIRNAWWCWARFVSRRHRMNVIVLSLTILLTRKLSLNLLLKALIYSLLLQIQNIHFHGHFSLMQCQLIRFQVKQLPPESLHYHNLHSKSQNFQDMVSSKVYFLVNQLEYCIVYNKVK